MAQPSALGREGGAATHDHVDDGVNGLADDLLRVPALPPVSCREVAPVSVVRGNDAQTWLLVWMRDEADRCSEPRLVRPLLFLGPRLAAPAPLHPAGHAGAPAQSRPGGGLLPGGRV